MELFAYRFLLNHQSPATAELERKITTILATGEPTTLPTEVLSALVGRRAAAKEVGPWVEGHYRQGIQVYPSENEEA